MLYTTNADAQALAAEMPSLRRLNEVNLMINNVGIVVLLPSSKLT